MKDSWKIENKIDRSSTQTFTINKVDVYNKSE